MQGLTPLPMLFRPHKGAWMYEMRNTKYKVSKATETRSTYNIVARGLQSPLHIAGIARMKSACAT